MIVHSNSHSRGLAQMRLDEHMMKLCNTALTGLALAFLIALLASCTPQPTPVYRTIQQPKLQVPAELTSPLERPNCLFRSNANLGDCILQQSGVIERANADRAALRKILDEQ